MKKIIKYNGLLALLFGAGMLAAQGTQLFQLQLEANDKYLTVRQGELSMEDELTGFNALAQSFIISRETEQTSSIAWAGDPNFLLKRGDDGISVNLGATNDADAQWILEYAGYPFIALTDLKSLTGMTSNDEVLSWTSTGGFSMIIPRVLEGGDDDPDGVSFRFKIKMIDDTF